MDKGFDLAKIRHIQALVVGSINPNVPFSDAEREKQVAFLNRCLEGIPRGVIIGSDKTVATYQFSGHQVVMEKTTYHIGFERKPLYLEDREDAVPEMSI
jgi:hypothetical protein